MVNGGTPALLRSPLLDLWPGHFRASAFEWLRHRWEDGLFPPKVVTVDLPVASLSECRILSRAWMVQAEMDAFRAADKIIAGPKAKPIIALVGHCMAARLGVVMNACHWGKMKPQPAKLCLEVNVGAIHSDFTTLAEAAATAAKGLELPLFAFITAEAGRLVHPALSEPTAVFRDAIVASHRGQDAWIEGHLAYGFTESVAAKLGMSKEAALPEELRYFDTHVARRRGQLHIDDGSEVFNYSVYHNAWKQDVVVPPPSPRDHSVDWRSWRQRSLLFVWVGSETSYVRRHLVNSWRGRHSMRGGGLLVNPTSEGLTNYTQLLQQAKWCGVPDGSTPWTWRFLDVLHCGCVPVVLSERWHPPYTRMIDWTKEGAPVLFIRPRRIPQLPAILAAIPDELWRRKQRATKAFADMLDVRSIRFHELWMGEVMLSQAEAAGTDWTLHQNVQNALAAEPSLLHD